MASGKAYSDASRIQGIFDLNWHEKTKYRVDPGFYNAEVSIIMNLDAYRKLVPAQRQFLEKQALALEALNDVWKKLCDEDTKRQAQVGIQAIAFDAATSKKYVDLAYDVAWASAIKASPEHGPQLKKLLSK